MACNIKYNNRFYTQEEGAAIASYHETVFNSLKLSGEALDKNPFSKFRDSGDKLRLPVQDTALLNEAKKLINNVKAKFGDVIKETTVMDGKTLTRVAKVDVTKYVPEIVDRYYRITSNEDEANEYILDGEVLPNTTQYRRVLKAGEETVNNIGFVDAQVSLMVNKFAEAGVDVEVMYDTTIKESGMLLGTKSPTYMEMVNKEEIREGTAVIIINPNKLFSDTVFHEFGHLFIDVIGGMSNPRLIEVASQLKGTALAEEVKATYPELQGNDLEKEIITTALGKAASELFTDQQQQSWWNRFVMWFKNTVNRILGVEKDKVTELASTFLNEEMTSLNTALSEITQLKKAEKKFKPNPTLERHLDSLQSIRSQAYSAITNQLQVIKKSSKTPKEVVAKMEALQGELDKLNKTEHSSAVLQYLGFVREQLNQIDANINKKNALSDSNPKTFLSVISGLNNLISSFELVKDINDALNSGLLDNEKEFTNAAIEEAIKEQAKTLTAEYNKIKDEIVAKSVKPMARFMAMYSNRARTYRREELESQFKSENPKQEGESSTEYAQRQQDTIEAQLEEEADELALQEEAIIERALRRGDADITAMGAWLSDEKDLNSAAIQLVSKILDDADTQKDKESLDNLAEARKVMENFRKEHSSNDPKKMYKGFYQESSDGNLYLTTQYSVEYYLEYKKMAKAMNDAERVYGSNSKEYKIASTAFAKWVKANTDGKSKRPVKKWLNSDYAKVKDTEMYQTLVKYMKENDANLQGNQSLIKTTSDETLSFYMMPSIGKKGFEQIASGSLVNNAWEAIQRIWKKRADDIDFGELSTESEKRAKELYQEIQNRITNGENVSELVDEINRLSILTNAIGEPKQQVPIFFRGPHNLKDQSYDLLSLVMIDNHMSINFKHKEKIKNTLELLVDIMNNKKITRTQGMMKKTLVHMLGKDVYEEVKQLAGKDSNEVKVLKSIIENRLYGIKTKNADFAKIANNLMAWSGTTMLGFNMLASTANLIQGKVYNFIEAYGGEHFNTKDLGRAEGKFLADMRYWMDDIGRPIDTSKTNLLLSLFNIQGEFKGLSDRLNEDARYKALMKRSSLFAYQHMGEFYIHSTLMYATLSGIKVKNADGQFINKEGVVVSKDKAMPLDEAFSVVDGKLEFNQHAKKTTFGTQDISLDVKNDKGILEVRNLINKIANDIHGNYNDEIQAMSQRYILGKMAFMLRKWIVRGFNRRWRGGIHAFKKKEELRKGVDTFYSEDLQSSQEGYYTTFLRFMSNVVGEFKNLGVMGAYSYGKNKLTVHEAANLRRAAMEIGFMMLTLLASMALYKLLDGIDEDDEEGLVYIAFYTRRLYTELSFFSNPLSTFQILRSPAASISYAESIAKLIGQLGTDGSRVVLGEGVEYYERGKNKGLPKVWKRTTDLLPILNHMNRTVGESASYVYNSN